jgi:hypothetical protein
MEKQGMVCGRKTDRAGLLTMKAKLAFCVTLIVFLLTPSLSLRAEENTDAEETKTSDPQVFASVDPAIPVVGRPMTITLLIDYPVPEDVTVIAPSFSGSLTLDRIAKTPRVTETRVFTVVEYRFVPVSGGRVVLESFTVVCPGGVTETGSFVLNIRREGEEPVLLTPRLAWEGAPRQMAAGDRVTLVLRAGGWNSRRPPPEFFMPPVPQGVILALSPLSEQERAGGIAVKLTLIPLNAGDFRLSARVIQHENVRFTIPALNIQITGSSAARPPGSAVESSGGDNAGNVTAPFPDFVLTTPEKSRIRENHRLQCENLYNTAKELWDSGLFAGALAELRRNERDHPAGALLKPIRRQAEENLGLFNAENESRLRRKILSGLFSFLLFLVIITLFICLFFIKKENSLRKKAFLCAVVLSAAGSFFFYRLADSRFVFPRKDNLYGVTKKTPVRRMADVEGEILFSFREGQPVVILLNSGSWVYVRTNDAAGSSGWIPAEEVEFY